jgi:hypothetical protein
MEFENFVSELNIAELTAIDGGKNIIEYAAYAIGYIGSWITDMSPEAAEAMQNSMH